MVPQRDTKGKCTLDEQRSPRDLDIPDGEGGVIVVTEPVYGAWDVYADEAIRELSARGLHGTGSGDDARDDRAGDGGADGSDQAGIRRESGAAAAGADSNQHPEHRDLSRTGSAGDASGAAAADLRRRKLTKAQRRARLQTQQALALRAQGLSLIDIAGQLGVTVPTIQGWFTTHRREVAIDDINDTLDQIAVPLATENLIHGLLAGDKDYTIETLKGRGQFRRHAEQEKPPATGLPELRIVFEAPAPTHGNNVGDPVATGRIMGVVSVPKQIEGTVVDSRPLSEPDDAHGTGQVQIPRPTATPV